MPEASFLDTGVVLGYCFRDDDHYYHCLEYLEDVECALYISDHVRDEYLNREPDLAEEIADGILDHVARLRRSEYEGQLDSMDTSQIRQHLIGGDNPASTTLYGFYTDQVPNFVQFEELVDRLRDLARDVEQNAIEKRTALEERVLVWERDEAYGDLGDDLTTIPWDDRRICLDAHDVAVATGAVTELATTNPTDLVDDGYRELILEHTSLADVVSLANRS